MIESRENLQIDLITETFPPEVNGVARTLEQLVSGLSDRGHRVGVVRPRQRQETRTPEFTADRLLVPGAPLPGYRRLRFGFYCRRSLARRWRHRQPDVVHVATEGPLGLAAIHAANRRRIPICSSFHTNFHSYGQFYGYGMLIRQALLYLRFVHNQTHRTLVPAPDTLETLRQQGFRNLAILGRGVDTRLFSPSRRSQRLRRQWGVHESAPAVLYVGRLAAEKNICLAIRAVLALRQRIPDTRFILVGDGPEEEELRRRYPDFEFSGVRTGVDLATHYASGDLLVFPSVTETFGNVVLEGMASGLAVVAFDYAAASLHIQHDLNGVKAPLGESKRFIEQTFRLGREPSLWRDLGRAARLTADRNSWTAVVEQFEDHLRVLSNGSGLARPG